MNSTFYTGEWVSSIISSCTPPLYPYDPARWYNEVVLIVPAEPPTPFQQAMAPILAAWEQGEPWEVFHGEHP